MTLLSPVESCARARELASLRLDGELSLLEAVSLRAHLRSCADCRAFAAGADQVARRLRSAPLDVPAFQVTLPRRRYRSVAALAPLAAAAAALGVAVLQATQLGPSLLPGGPGAAGAQSNAATLHAAYAEDRLAKLFLNGSLATRAHHMASVMK